MAERNRARVFTSRVCAVIRARARLYGAGACGNSCGRVYAYPHPPVRERDGRASIHTIMLKRFHTFRFILPQVLDSTQFFFYKKFFAKNYTI